MSAHGGGVWRALLVGLVLAVVFLAGCSNAGKPTAPTAPAASPIDESALTSGPTPEPIASPKPVKVPTTRSNFPDGVYRTQFTIAQMEKAGFFDPGAQGTWTLTVKAGTYRMECAAFKDPVLDCGAGHTPKRHTVDYGTLHGTGSTVWFIHDMVHLSKTYGCIRQSQGPRGCGPEGGFHMTWQPKPAGIVFSDYVGLGDEEGPPLAWWYLKPWTRIS